MQTISYSNKDIQGCLHNIIRGIVNDNWRPNYIVGLTRGGLVPAVQLSHYFNVPMYTVTPWEESNCWIAEEALGYVPQEQQDVIGTNVDPSFRKKILIVDDINDTGATYDWLVKDWMGSCLPAHEAWKDVWGQNVRTAFLINNEASDLKIPNYYGIAINKLEKPEWCVFPWEEWWRRT
jgi:hypoxanthine phosphoribosyltransferase